MRSVRLMTLNLWGDQAPLQRRLAIVARAARALGVDVLALQEVREVPGSVENTAYSLARDLGFSVAYSCATPWGGGEEGLAIVARWPVARSEARELPHTVEGERRIVLGAELTTPAGALAVFTTHLNYRLGDGLKREAQACAVDEFVSSWSTMVPRLLAGDFNATPEHDEIRFLRGQHTLVRDGQPRRAIYQDAWERCNGAAPGLTWSRRNPQARRLEWLDLDRRLDYVFVTPLRRDGRGRVLEARIVLDEPDADGLLASDHYGLLAEVQVVPDA